MLDLRTSQQRAIEKAQRLQWWRETERIADVWLVRSESHYSTLYVVEQKDGRWVCDCKAGKLGTPCFHAASAWLSWLRDQAGRSN